MQRLLLLAFCLLAFSVDARAEHEAEPAAIENWWSWDYGPSAKEPSHRRLPPPFGFALLNFVVFAGIMFKLAGKPMRDYVLKRHDTLKHDLEEAAKLRQEAQTALDNFRQKLGQMDNELSAILRSAREEAQQEKQRVLSSAKDQAARIETEARRQVEDEVERAKRLLKRQVVEQALSAAEAILAKQINSSDQQAMAEDYVRTVEASRHSEVRS